MRLADLAVFRQAAYQIFGGVLLYPDEGRLRPLRVAARRLERWSGPLVQFAFFPEWTRLLRALGTWPESARGEIEEAYVRLFLVNPAGLFPPYASQYLQPSSPAHVMAAVEAEYRKAGLSPDPRLSEPPDHAAVELEFLSFLCGEEARAWREQGLREATDLLQTEARFLSMHLCPWLPDFAHRVMAREGGGFYALVTDAVAAFVQHDRELVVVLLDRYRGEVEHAA